MKKRKNKIFIIFKNYFLVFAILIILLSIIYKFYVFLNGDYYILNQEKMEIESKQRIVVEEIEILKEKQKYLETEDGKERVKRKINLYKKPGEKVIHIVDY